MNFCGTTVYSIVHEMQGRMRLRPQQRILQPLAVEHIATNLEDLAASIAITVSHTTGSILLTYTNPAIRPLLCRKLSNHLAMPCACEDLCPSLQELQGMKCSPSHATQSHPSIQKQQHNIVNNPIPARLVSYLLPQVINAGIAFVRALPYLYRGLRELARGKLGLDVLDAAALGVCLLQRDFRTLSTITFFFRLAEYLEFWTKKKSHENLAESLKLNISHVWVKEGDLERQIPIHTLQKNDIVIVRSGAVIPVDGTIVAGEAYVNQASMTGEPLAIYKTVHATVFAGTVLMEGELCVRAVNIGEDRRIHGILHYIEESEAAKASIQTRYEEIADKIVPYNFLLAGLVYLITRNPLRAGAVLLVDYSCAIRLSTPLAVLAAMQESAQHNVLIKGGRFLEVLAKADTIVFDKTGTLTHARPTVAKIIPFGTHSREMILKLAACLEEHFPHPVGLAVVKAAEKENLQHKEEHAKVEYIVAHGIASTLNDVRILIGSEHFIVEDEKISISPAQQAECREQSNLGRSLLYLAIGNEIAGVLAIEDYLREEIPCVIAQLRATGIQRIIMLTGDGKATAQAIATQAGITEYHAALLPEKKAQIIEGLQQQGHCVLMIGDGVNDAPALSQANAGIAMQHGAEMTKEIADIVLTSGEPEALLVARQMGKLTLQRIKHNMHASILWNSIFLGAALSGIIRPSISAFLHNASTAMIAVQSMAPMLPAPNEPNNDIEEIA